jgi:DNA-binding PadR family transcriptional regulator
MEAENLVRSDWDDSRQGPARHVFRITEAGQQCLARWEATLEEYSRAVCQMLNRMRRLHKPGPRVTHAKPGRHVRTQTDPKKFGPLDEETAVVA